MTDAQYLKTLVVCDVAVTKTNLVVHEDKNRVPFVKVSQHYYQHYSSGEKCWLVINWLVRILNVIVVMPCSICLCIFVVWVFFYIEAGLNTLTLHVTDIRVFLLLMKVCKLRVCFIKIVPWSLWQLIVELDWPYCSWWTFRLLSNISYHSAYQVSLVECTVPLMLLDIGSHRTICVQSWRSHGGDWWREGKSTCCCY